MTTAPSLSRERIQIRGKGESAGTRAENEEKNPWPKPRDRLPERWEGKEEKGRRRRESFDKSLRSWQPAFAESFPIAPGRYQSRIAEPTVKCIFRWIACPFFPSSFSLSLSSPLLRLKFVASVGVPRRSTEFIRFASSALNGDQSRAFQRLFFLKQLHTNERGREMKRKREREGKKRKTLSTSLIRHWTRPRDESVEDGNLRC